MKIDALLSLDNLNEYPATVTAAEAIGFDCIWVGEARHEGLLPMPLIAEHTQRLHFGNAIVVAFARSPMILAHAAWDLAAQSGGRFILGLGTQVKAHIERRFGMTWDAPAPRLREAILAVRAIWDCWQTGAALNFRGEYYKLTLMSPFFNPGPIATPTVPIFIAGVNAPLCRLAGELADGFHVHPFHTAKYLSEVIVPAVAEGAAVSGRTRSAVQLASSVFTITNETEREKVRQQLAFYAATPSYRTVLDCHGWSAIGERLSFLAARGRWEEMPREVTDEMLDAFAVTPGSDGLAAKLLAKYDGLLDRIFMYEPYRPGTDDAHWRALVETVHTNS